VPSTRAAPPGTFGRRQRSLLGNCRSDAQQHDVLSAHLEPIRRNFILDYRNCIAGRRYFLPFLHMRTTCSIMMYQGHQFTFALEHGDGDGSAGLIATAAWRTIGIAGFHACCWALLLTVKTLTAE